MLSLILTSHLHWCRARLVNFVYFLSLLIFVAKYSFSLILCHHNMDCIDDRLDTLLSFYNVDELRLFTLVVKSDLKGCPKPADQDLSANAKTSYHAFLLRSLCSYSNQRWIIFIDFWCELSSRNLWFNVINENRRHWSLMCN